MRVKYLSTLHASVSTKSKIFTWLIYLLNPCWRFVGNIDCVIDHVQGGYSLFAERPHKIDIKSESISCTCISSGNAKISQHAIAVFCHFVLEFNRLERRNFLFTNAINICTDNIKFYAPLQESWRVPFRFKLWLETDIG